MFSGYLQRVAVAMIHIVRGRHSVAERVDQFGPIVQKRLADDFERIGMEYPPEQLVLIFLKQERRLDVWVGDPLKLLKSYPVLAASGELGPKLKEGDHQVPEGLYQIESLNPNSLYHLALRLNYPNAFDRAKARLDGRTDLGGDIMIHGKSCSIGCLAMGDRTAEDLFVLAAEVGVENIKVIISPLDFRKHKTVPGMSAMPSWTQELYSLIKNALCAFCAP
jgi:murein L,D-transpeptidase YafK